MSETRLDLTHEEIDLIYQLCKSSQVAGIETARVLVSVADKCEQQLESLKMPDSQTKLPIPQE